MDMDHITSINNIKINRKFVDISITGKVSKHEVIFGPYFPVFTQCI